MTARVTSIGEEDDTHVTSVDIIDQSPCDTWMNMYMTYTSDLKWERPGLQVYTHINCMSYILSASC